MVNGKLVYEKVLEQVQKKISGKADVIELLFIALVADGHALLEGVPGTAKTTMVKALADTVHAHFDRVQGTPDLDFEDIVGHTYIDDRHQVRLKKGPIFTNLFLVDELNRAPMRTTTALLESLEERQVTIAEETFPLEKPFIALATQNPLSIEGTTSLPKVLTDRFLMRISVAYPNMEEEEHMLRMKEIEATVKIEKVVEPSDILDLQVQAAAVTMPDNVVEYITKIVEATRTDIHVVMGASPRAEISFMKCGKTRALIQGHTEVTVEDIKYLTRPVLSHRIVVRATGGLGVNGVIDGIVASVR
jgi:MoxR-like ATPase